MSKNACLAMQSIFATLQARETDPHIETVLPILMKRAADTNQFISESAEQTLTVIVQVCTDNRVFNALQMQHTRNNKQKELMCFCYTLLVEKLGLRIK